MMAIRRAGALLRGLGALSATLLLLVGVPVLLIVGVGWPLPHEVPDTHAMRRSLDTGITDEFILNALAVIAWIVWVQLVVALAFEAIAAIRGRQPRSLPVAPGLQLAAARLVAGILLLAGPLQPARAAVAAPAAPPPAAVVTTAGTPAVAWPSDPVLEVDPPVPATGAAPATASTRSIVVERHDTYWSLAERELGDGLRWREIHDSNVGRAMDDGHVIVSGDETLRAGWVLNLTVTDATKDTVTVEPGDSIWTLAEGNLESDLARPPTDEETTPYWQTVIEANRDQLVEPTNPSLIVPGQILDLPPTGLGPPPAAAAMPPLPPAIATPAPEPPSAPAESPSPPQAEVDRSEPAPRATTDHTDPELEDVSTPDDGQDRVGDGDGIPFRLLAVGGLTSVAMAVGVKRAVDRRRRRYGEENPGRAAPPTHEADRAVHRQAVANADEQGLGDLRSAMADLAASLVELDSAARPRIVRHGDDSLEVLMDSHVSGDVSGWQRDETGFLLTWSGRVGGEIDDCVAPLLVTLGQPDDDAQLYIDLESHGLVELTGDPEVARGVARSFATEVALSPLTETVRIVVVGDLLGNSSSALDHLRIVDSWQEVETEVRSWAEECHQYLVEAGQPGPLAARCRDMESEILAPLLVIASKAPSAELAAELADLHPVSVAVVIADDFDRARCTIDCRSSTLTVEDVGLACVPQSLDDDTLASVLRILDTAEGEALAEVEPPAADADDEPIDLRDTPDADQPTLFDVPGEVDFLREAIDDAEAEPEYEFLVRLLGDIRIEGCDPLRPKPTAVLAYLTLHRSVTVEALEDACWTDPSSNPNRLKAMVSECRAAVGSVNLPIASKGRYTAGPGIITDTELFDRRVARAANQSGEEQAATYRSALELITGKVLSYPSRAGNSFGWIDTENLRSRWELRIEGVALQAIESLVVVGNIGGAIEVAEQILLALPLSTPVTEALMRVHARAGNSKALETVYKAHVDALERILKITPDDTTVALHEELVAV